MKIDIGPYPQDFIPVRHWYRNTESKITLKLLDFLGVVIQPINKLIAGKRKVKIKYHNYDTWSLDHTLALIIVPGLKQLKATNHGYASVENEDLPTACLKDASGEERWEWVMDEMIWAFEQHADEDDTAQYCHNTDQLEMVFEDDNTLSFNYQKDPNKPAYFRDVEGLKKHDERKANGRRLFAKYYECLWD